MKTVRKLFSTLKEGIKGIWKNKNLGLVSVTSTFFTLFIIGIITIITVTVNNMSLQVERKVNDVEIYIVNEASKVDIENLRTKIESVNIKKKVEFRSSEEALKLMKKSWGKDAHLLEGMDYEGLLPASFIVSLENIDQADEFVNSIKNEKIVEDVKYYKDLVSKISKVSNYTKIFGTILVMVLIVVSIFIISNTIKLTVFSRKNEIAIMKNVGATNTYIRIPFMVEGVFFSVLASALSYLAVLFLYKFAYENFASRLSENLSILNLIRPGLYKMPLLYIFMALGLGIGIIGSVFSIRRYLVDREVNYVD